jgi:hypothetical protein
MPTRHTPRQARTYESKRVQSIQLQQVFWATKKEKTQIRNKTINRHKHVIAFSGKNSAHNIVAQKTTKRTNSTCMAHSMRNRNLGTTGASARHHEVRKARSGIRKSNKYEKDEISHDAIRS